MVLQIGADRFERPFEAYSSIGGTADGGLRRLALTDADRGARDGFVDDLEALGFDVSADEVGNGFANATCSLAMGS